MLSFTTLLPVALLALTTCIPSTLAANSTISDVEPRTWGSSTGNCNTLTDWLSPKGGCIRYPSMPSSPSHPPSSPPTAPDCLPNIPKPPVVKSCPHGWSWAGSFCVPYTPQDASNSSPSCRVTSHTWCSTTYTCTTDTFPSESGDDCSTHTQFWWSKGNGGGFCCQKSPPSPPAVQPPKGSSCPSDGWFWHQKENCCIPKTIQACSTPKPTCSTKGHTWNTATKCCQGPTPSGRRRRANARAFLEPTLPLGEIDPARCANGLTACPIEGALNGADYECLDPLFELESCGGCRSMGAGQDCTALPNAKSVGCEVGQCKVYSCASGFTLSANGTACVKTPSSRAAAGEAASLFAQSRRSRSVRARR